MKVLIAKKITATSAYELYKYSTHFAIKIFKANNPMPIKVHVGKESYINKLWNEYIRSKHYETPRWNTLLHRRVRSFNW